MVLGVLSGRYDVGFIRTDMIEITKDDDGNYLDPDLFKVIEPKIFVMVRSSQPKEYVVGSFVFRFESSNLCSNRSFFHLG